MLLLFDKTNSYIHQNSYITFNYDCGIRKNDWRMTIWFNGFLYLYIPNIGQHHSDLTRFIQSNQVGMLLKITNNNGNAIKLYLFPLPLGFALLTFINFTERFFQTIFFLDNWFVLCKFAGWTLFCPTYLRDYDWFCEFMDELLTVSLITCEWIIQIKITFFSWREIARCWMVEV